MELAAAAGLSERGGRGRDGSFFFFFFSGSSIHARLSWQLHPAFSSSAEPRSPARRLETFSGIFDYAASAFFLPSFL